MCSSRFESIRKCKAGVKRRFKKKTIQAIVTCYYNGKRSIAREQDGGSNADCKDAMGVSKGGGLVLFVNECWCCPGHITVKENLCNKDIELLAVGMGLYCLPREFSYVISITVYIPPSASVSNACEHINTITARMQSKYPQALIIISRDFNQVSLRNTPPTFT
ncbi:HTH-type transcriptional activator RhaS [Labeo rohita]|uniref:HTH-type transcriptional activator RhaS n=1 Tax=Labeo rohita TaxID=84645 RepID=A0ABQ8MQM3_LABRO|nr:HTH-type transcriptional activator RhaS [Labeo rohita]